MPSQVQVTKQRRRAETPAADAPTVSRKIARLWFPEGG